jgi:hypothetical protein
LGIFPSSLAETAGHRYGVPVARVSGIFLADKMVNAVLSILLSQVEWAREVYVHSAWFLHLRRIANRRSALWIMVGLPDSMATQPALLIRFMD